MENLVLKYQAGDEGAFEEIFNNKDVQGILNKFAYENVLGLCREDLKQEMNIALYEAVKGFKIESGAKFSTMLWACCKRRLFSLRKYAGQHKRLANFTANSFDKMVEDGYDVEGTEESFELLEIQMLIEKQGFTAREKEVCLLLIKEKSASTKADLARALGITPAGVSHILKSVRSKFKSNK